MAKKKVSKIVKIQFPAGQAKPGASLAGAGINMPQFCTAFNDQTRERAGETVPVIISVYEDKSFDFVLKTAPASEMIKKYAKIAKGSSEPNKVKVATLSLEDLQKIAEYKMPDLNAIDIKSAMRIIAGTARNMGVEIAGSIDA